jgi:hypothetical protein
MGISTASYAILHSYTIDKSFVNPNRTEVTVKHMQWKGRPAVAISYRKGPGWPLIATVFVPEMDYCIVRAELTEDGDGKRGNEYRVMEAEPARFGKNGTWFPKSISMTATSDGAALERCKIQVRDAVFNEPIDPSMFQIIGMEIPADTYANVPAKPGVAGSGRMVWDGTKLVSVEPKQEVLDDVPPAGLAPQSRSWALVVSITLACVAAVSLAANFWLSRKASA